MAKLSLTVPATRPQPRHYTLHPEYSPIVGDYVVRETGPRKFRQARIVMWVCAFLCALILLVPPLVGAVLNWGKL
jgi:hypothetical protein